MMLTLTLIAAVVIYILFGSTMNARALVDPLVQDGIAWYNAQDWGVNGKGWDDTQAYYHRLPARAEGVVPPAVWTLSQHSAGMYVEFATDSTSIRVRWELTGSRLAVPHMPATGVSGVDLYVLDDSGQWRWVFVGKPDVYPQLDQQLVAGIAPGLRQYRLYLPLYNGVNSVEVGVALGSQFTPIAPNTDKPVVFYGTSITHGIAASRPGMAYPAILGRRLGVGTINLGFSGSAKMEPSLAAFVSELDPSIYVLDAFPNMNATLINLNFERFVRRLRAAHPATPVVVVEDRAFANTSWLPTRQDHYTKTRHSIRTALDRLRSQGVTGLHLIPRDGLFGTDNEGTVDSSHPTDLGFMRYADVVEPVLRRLLM